MGKYLRDISIHVHPSQDLPHNRTRKDFNLTTHCVQDIFWYKIPSKFEFHGISKINIRLQESPVVDAFHRYLDGITEYRYGGFDFQNYFEQPTGVRNSIILDVLRAGLKAIPDVDTEKLNVLLEITNFIKDSNFVYEFESRKLSKYNRSRTVRAIVSFKVDNNGQNAYLKIVSKSGETLRTTHLLKNVLFEYRDNLRRTRWKGDIFEILNKDDEVYREFRT